MKFLTLTIMTAFLFGLVAAGQVLGAGQEESGKSKSQGAAQMEQSGKQQASAQKLSSEQIREVQQSLQEKGVDPGPVDGIMGPKTRAAIQQFQQQEGITATGQPNEQTLEALDVEFMGVSPAFGEKEQMKEQKQDRMQQEDPLKQDPSEGMQQQEKREVERQQTR